MKGLFEFMEVLRDTSCKVGKVLAKLYCFFDIDDTCEVGAFTIHFFVVVLIFVDVGATFARELVVDPDADIIGFFGWYISELSLVFSMNYFDGVFVELVIGFRNEQRVEIYASKIFDATAIVDACNLCMIEVFIYA